MNKKDNLLTKRLEDDFISTVTRRYSVKTALLRITKVHRKKPVLNIGFFLFFPAYFLRTHFFLKHLRWLLLLLLIIISSHLQLVHELIETHPQCVHNQLNHIHSHCVPDIHLCASNFLRTGPL